MTYISTCRICRHPGLVHVWRLANSPYGDLFKGTQLAATNTEKQPLSLVLCNHCKLLQLHEETEITMTYDDYLYRSSITHGLSSFYEQVVTRLVAEYLPSKTKTILDIGSNDGSYLVKFINQGFKVLGVEPTGTNAEFAIARGVPTINDYFTEEAVQKILAIDGKPSLISINYTLANIPDVYSFVKLVSNLMDEDTVLSVITGYHPDQFSVNMFEYINHDHLSYFTIASMLSLCRELDLKIIDILRAEHKGGSIQFLISSEKSRRPVQSSVNQMLQREDWLGANDVEFTRALETRITKINDDLNSMLSEESTTTLYGVGASISTTYLCNQFGISGRISGLYDDDKNKIGKFAPGSGIEVYALSTLPSGDDSLAIILAWQHTEKLISRLKEIHFSGRILIPLPIPILIEI